MWAKHTGTYAAGWARGERAVRTEDTGGQSDQKRGSPDTGTPSPGGWHTGLVCRVPVTCTPRWYFLPVYRLLSAPQHTSHGRTQSVPTSEKEPRHLECPHTHVIPVTCLQFSGAGTRTKKLPQPAPHGPNQRDGTTDSSRKDVSNSHC